MFQIKFAGKTKHIYSVNNFFFLKIIAFLDNVEKYGRAGQAADENKIWHIHFPRLGIMTTDTITIYNIAVWQQQCLRYHASICIHTLQVLFPCTPPSQEQSQPGPFQKLTPGVLVTENHFQRRLTKANSHSTEGLRHRAGGCMVLGRWWQCH